jgi:hypothetical protein
MDLHYRDACKKSNLDGTYLPSNNASSSIYSSSSFPTLTSSIYSNISLCSIISSTCTGSTGTERTSSREYCCTTTAVCSRIEDRIENERQMFCVLPPRVLRQKTSTYVSLPAAAARVKMLRSVGGETRDPSHKRARAVRVREAMTGEKPNIETNLDDVYYISRTKVYY